MVPPLELKLNRVICPKSVATSKASFFFGEVPYIYIVSMNLYRIFLTWGYPPPYHPFHTAP